MARIRYALATERSKDAIAINDALTSASIEPPPPFHGKGTYRAAPDGTTSWTGPLSVSLPGAPRLPLTGERVQSDARIGFLSPARRAGAPLLQGWGDGSRSAGGPDHGSFTGVRTIR